MENDQRIQPYNTDRVYQERPHFSWIWATVGLLALGKIAGKFKISWFVVLAPVWIPIVIMILSFYILGHTGFH